MASRYGSPPRSGVAVEARKTVMAFTSGSLTLVGSRISQTPLLTRTGARGQELTECSPRTPVRCVRPLAPFRRKTVTACGMGGPPRKGGQEHGTDPLGGSSLRRRRYPALVRLQRLGLRAGEGTLVHQSKSDRFDPRNPGHNRVLPGDGGFMRSLLALLVVLAVPLVSAARSTRWLATIQSEHTGDTATVTLKRSEEHTSELQSHHVFPTRRSSDLWSIKVSPIGSILATPGTTVCCPATEAS